MKEYFLLIVVVFVFCIGGAFWAGTKYPGALGVAPAPGAGQPGGSFAPPSGQTPPATVRGKVISKQSSGFVVETPDGSQKTILFASTTQATVTTISTESPEKVPLGEEVFIIGSAASGGAIQAQAINILHAPQAPAL